MIGFDPKLQAVMVDIDRWRAREREGRQAAIAEQAARLEGGASRLVGHLPAGDAVFGQAIVPVSEPEPAEMDRGAVFAALRSGASADGLPAEYVRDYENSKQSWW